MTTAHRELWRVGGEIREDHVFVMSYEERRVKWQEQNKKARIGRGTQKKTRNTKWKRMLPEIRQFLLENGPVEQLELARFVGMRSVNFINDLSALLPIYDEDDGKIGILED